MDAPHLLDLPDELLLKLVAQLSSGPDAAAHSVSLPLVCVAFRRICANRVIRAASLMARVRGLTTVDEAPASDEAAAGRVWGAAADVHAFIVSGSSPSGPDSAASRAAALINAEPGAADCLQDLLRRCSLGECDIPPAPLGAEDLFAACEASYFSPFGLSAFRQKTQLLPTALSRSATLRPPTRGPRREAAMQRAESAAYAREVAKHQLVASEVDRQARRQLGKYE